MKSTKDNRPAVKFSDIVKELHSYANSEQAVIDFASELEKVINLPEEFELSQYYFEDNDAKNYLRKKLNFKSVILTGIKNSTTTVSNIKDDFFEIYKDCYHKYVKSGNPFFNRLSIMYDLNLYYDIEQKKFVIYEATNVGYPGDFEFYSKKDFYGTYIGRVDSIFPVSISDRGQNSNLLFIRPMDSLESIPMSITCNFDVVLLKYISGLIDTKEFSAEFLKDINSYIESVVKKYLKLPNETLDENILSSYPAAIFTENDLVKIMSRTLFDNETYNDLSGIFENRKNNEYICSFLEKLLDPSVTAPSKILSLIATNPIFEFEKLPGLKSENKKELLIKLMSKSSGKISTTLLSYFNNDELYEMFKNTTVHQLKKMANNKKVVFQKDKSNNLLIGKRIVYFDEPIQDITFSENQLTEFKSEIIPLLEQIQDKIFIKLTVNSVHPADSSKSNEEKVFDIIHSYQDKYGFYYNLCKLVDWYPKTLKILSIQNENLSCFGKVSYINQLKKKFNLDIDYTFFIFKSSSIKTEKDLFDIIGDDFENVKVLFEGSLSGAELEQYELMRSYGVKEEIASVSLSY